MKLISFIAGIMMLCLTCQSKQGSGNENVSNPNNHEVIVKEVVQVSGYTYLNVTENGKDLWLAGPTSDAKVGETWYYEKGFEMTNFKSKELNKTFESIMFIEKISKEPFPDPKTAKATSPGSSKSNITKKEIKISPASGGISISELYSGKESFSGKTVKIKGLVTKFSPAIMGINWIHIQDGTESKGSFDLTVTSNSVVNVGDTLTFEGSITLNKDLGYGYFFDIIMENATIK
jgi:hypothetical protein